MQSKGSAKWQGGFKDGRGSISTASGALKDEGYSVGSRFEGDKGTNPEELIAAAHAACFSMALSLLLGKTGMDPQSIETSATVTLDKAGDGFEITSSHLDVIARIPGADQAKFLEVAKQAEQGCPVSKVLKARISMDARLVG
ncbi:MAG TPA: OsmC family protein [Rhodanobacteraceae bacterium]|nr:OsmC family protein [Rhodanobacteraceae bacterium]